MPEFEVLTPEEAAEYLRVDPQTIYRRLREGKLPGARIGRQWRISRQALEEFLRGSIIADNEAEDDLDHDISSSHELTPGSQGSADVKAGRRKGHHALDAAPTTGLDEEDIKWLDAGAQEVVDRLEALEAEVPPEDLKAWKQAMVEAVRPATYVPGKGLVLEGEQ